MSDMLLACRLLSKETPSPENDKLKHIGHSALHLPDLQLWELVLCSAALLVFRFEVSRCWRIVIVNDTPTSKYPLQNVRRAENACIPRTLSSDSLEGESQSELNVASHARAGQPTIRTIV